MYVDDIVTGTGSEKEAIDLQRKHESIFANDSIELYKCSSNLEKLLSNIPLDHQQKLLVSFEDNKSSYN